MGPRGYVKKHGMKMTPSQTHREELGCHEGQGMSVAIEIASRCFSGLFLSVFSVSP